MTDDFLGLQCPQCDYDLTGLHEPRCPECGIAIDIVKLRHDLESRNDLRRRALGVLSLPLTLLVLQVAFLVMLGLVNADLVQSAGTLGGVLGLPSIWLAPIAHTSVLILAIQRAISRKDSPEPRVRRLYLFASAASAVGFLLWLASIQIMSPFWEANH